MCTADSKMRNNTRGKNRVPVPVREYNARNFVDCDETKAVEILASVEQTARTVSREICLCWFLERFSNRWSWKESVRSRLVVVAKDGRNTGRIDKIGRRLTRRDVAPLDASRSMCLYRETTSFVYSLTIPAARRFLFLVTVFLFFSQSIAATELLEKIEARGIIKDSSFHIFREDGLKLKCLFCDAGERDRKCALVVFRASHSGLNFRLSYSLDAIKRRASRARISIRFAGDVSPLDFSLPVHFIRVSHTTT